MAPLTNVSNFENEDFALAPTGVADRSPAQIWMSKFIDIGDFEGWPAGPLLASTTSRILKSFVNARGGRLRHLLAEVRQDLRGRASWRILGESMDLQEAEIC